MERDPEHRDMDDPVNIEGDFEDVLRTLLDADEDDEDGDPDPE